MSWLKATTSKEPCRMRLMMSASVGEPTYVWRPRNGSSTGERRAPQVRLGVFCVAKPKPASSIAESTTRTCTQIGDVRCAVLLRCATFMHHASHLIPRPRVSAVLEPHSAWEDQAARWSTVLHSHLDHRHVCE